MSAVSEIEACEQGLLSSIFLHVHVTEYSNFKPDNAHLTHIKALETQLAEAERSYQRLYLLFKSACGAETKCHFMQIRIDRLEECNRGLLKEIGRLGGDKGLLDDRSM